MQPQTVVKVSRKKQLLDHIGNLKSFKILERELEYQPEDSVNRVMVEFSLELLPEKDEIIYGEPTDTSLTSMTREIKSGGFVKDGIRERVDKNCEGKELVRDKLKKETYMEE